MKKLFISFILCFVFFLSKAQTSIAPEDAKNYIGKTVTVCGKVKSTYQPNTKSHPTFIDFGNKYPNAVFSIVIWESDLSKFSYKPKKKLKRKHLCVTGVVKMYKDKPEIVVSDPSQIKIK